MVYQTSTNGQRIDETAAAVGGNVANLASDLLSLAELQARLVALDLRESGAQALIPAAVVTGGVCLALGTVPVLLLGISGALAGAVSISLVSAEMMVSVVAMAAAAVCVWIGCQKMIAALNVLHRSREEFEANLRWIKKAIQQSTSSTSRR